MEGLLVESNDNEVESNLDMHGSEQLLSRISSMDLVIENHSNKVVEELAKNMDKVDLIKNSNNADGSDFGG